MQRIFSGDDRLLQTEMLMLVHSFWFRFHNHITDFLSVLCGYNDEKAFNEGRRVTTAAYQGFIYNFYLPEILGKSLHIFEMINM